MRAWLRLGLRARDRLGSRGGGTRSRGAAGRHRRGGPKTGVSRSEGGPAAYRLPIELRLR